MQNIKITFNNIDEDNQHILIARLSEIGFEGFEQMEESLFAYIHKEKFNDGELQDAAGSLSYQTEAIAPQNWNEVWESNFEPVFIDDFCTIRADFHLLKVATPYEIIITPKMSFGTGHHATTQLMVGLMKDMDIKGKQVLDFGTGTGVLAILAEKMGAYYVLGIDNDEWSIENATENLKRNNCTKTTVLQVTDEHLPPLTHDIILANINRNILLQYMAELYRDTKVGGTVLLSGLLIEDKDIIMQAAVNERFVFNEYRELNKWIAMSFKK